MQLSEVVPPAKSSYTIVLYIVLLTTVHDYFVLHPIIVQSMLANDLLMFSLTIRAC